MPNAAKAPRAAVFDFDGTLSTLRCGWESVMRGMMREILPPLVSDNEIDAYIDESTGVQTIFQMKWLARRVSECGLQARDAWDYKAEYNARLMREISTNKRGLAMGALSRDDFIVSGGEAFLGALSERGVSLYLASGTDHADVVSEAEALGLSHYFMRIAGAPPRDEKCSKEAVLRSLIAESGLDAGDILVVGDGKVEIALGKQCSARTIGVASDEARRRGFNETKARRLEKAGADIIIGDFERLAELTEWVFGE